MFTCVPVMNWSRVEICAPALSYTSGVNEKVPIEHKTTLSLHSQLVLAKCRRRLILKSSAVIVKAVFSLTSFTPLWTLCFYPPKLVRIVLAKTESFDFSLSGCGSLATISKPKSVALTAISRDLTAARRIQPCTEEGCWESFLFFCKKKISRFVSDVLVVLYIWDTFSSSVHAVSLPYACNCLHAQSAD